MRAAHLMCVNWHSVLLLGFYTFSFARADASAGCSQLAKRFQTDTLSPASAGYLEEAQDNYSISCRLTPKCIFTPRNVSEVAIAISIINATSSNFAVRSGGHTTSVGFANTNSGILISLDHFNTTVVSADKKVVSVGPGQPWQSVYDVLTPLGLSVEGGRLGPVGVGGLLLGGGLGYGSNAHGLGCDSIINFEVVTGDGVIRNANANENSDLYWALKGGSSGFGIVTRFDLQAHPLGAVWAGVLAFSADQIPAILKLYHDYTANEPDPKSHLAIPIVSGPAVNGTLAEVGLYYSEPLAAPPPVFAPFFELPFLQSTVTNTTLSGIAAEEGRTDGTSVRALFRAMSFKRNAAMEAASLQIWQDTIASLGNLEGRFFDHAYQPISRGIQASRNGGNALGLDPENGLIHWIALTIQWSNPSDDALVLAAMQNCTLRMEAESAKQNSTVRIRYLNDASPDQQVYQTYGPQNVQKLQNIQKKFNNFRIFNQLQNKHFPL